jgi:general secretion pathway protein A
MYDDFFGLSKPPFLATPDPEFLFPTRGHGEALDGLAYAALGRKSLILLAGEAGTGKTTLLRSLMRTIPPQRAKFGLMVHPTLNTGEFLEMVMLGLGIGDLPPGKPRRLLALERHLLDHEAAGRAVVLLLDEAHRLPADVLEEVRLLANLEAGSKSLLQIVLSGQNEINAVLNRPDLRQLGQRFAHRFSVHPLCASEVAAYVSHRWAHAGGCRPHPFGEDALDYLAVFSGGIPRRINTICDNALLVAWCDRRREVRPEDVVAAAKNLAWVHVDDTPDSRESAAARMAVVWSKPKWSAGRSAPA